LTIGRAAASSGVSSGGGANCLITLRRTPVAGCFRRTTGLYPKSASTKKTISSSRMRTSLLQTTFSHRWMDDFTRASSSSVPTPAAVTAGGTAGTKASGLAPMRCSPSLTNSECNRRTSRNCVVRNLGKLVCSRTVSTLHFLLGQRMRGSLQTSIEYIHRHRISRWGPSGLSAPDR
jgi:hypothetical protein